MFAGWIKPFKLDRPVGREEYYAELPKQRQPGIIPDSFGSLISFNSTYAEFIDRRDRLRGMASTMAGMLGTLTMLGLWLFFVGFFSGWLSGWGDRWKVPVGYLFHTISRLFWRGRGVLVFPASP